MGASRDAGQLADAALHKVGQHLGLGSPRSPRAVKAAFPDMQQPVAPPPAASVSPPSTTGSSQDLDAAASMPLPGAHKRTVKPGRPHPNLDTQQRAISATNVIANRTSALPSASATPPMS